MVREKSDSSSRANEIAVSREDGSTESETSRLIGYVVWWDDVKGFGFLKHPSTKAEFFCHYSQVVMPNPGQRRTLMADQRVEFEINKRDGKVQAENVVPLEG